ncbi:acetolactate synthase-1/2/3 large subunit [Psychrobacillus insolitus]|uniref:Acetolactate synthase-1/2/3 large subunit n=1 Tax=Psychrobacillus insolitus TaxID=1461 RepID=A0A2W7MYB7_9BACI|nr:thiamine pyrophosphate-requiring protein [Psychrobacillus insolitus]PZX02340.1 acetolactate synthase-1/2/3 large subunit [Psychrobacillus insolitus]
MHNNYTAADALMEALQEVGISHLFCNLGSDHPSIIEALAKAKEDGRALPKAIICPHESVALSAAQGYAMLSGQAQGVMIHTDVGTLNLGGAIHNAFRARVPVFVFAGETPFTMNGELPGSRNSYVNYLQNVYDQRSILRSYVKWEGDIRTGKNVKQLVYRAMQMAKSDPAGPVYLTGAREVLEENVDSLPNAWEKWSLIEQTTLPQTGFEELAHALIEAENPLVITTYLGRKVEAVQELIKFCEKLAIPVVEQIPTYVNFPRDHPLHAGYDPNPSIQQADIIVAIDTDVPWLTTQVHPKDDCNVYFIDLDPIKEEIPLWHIPAIRNYRADAYETLRQLNSVLAQKELNEEKIQQRAQRLVAQHEAQRKSWAETEVAKGGTITPEWLTTCLRDVVDDETIILDETITNTMTVCKHLPRNKVGTYFSSGGTSLGWNGGAAIGMKMANPAKTVVSLTGDGTYFFSVPASVHWMSRRYEAPFLTVIYNNQGWNATKMNYLKRYPEGTAEQTDRYWVNFDQSSDLAKVAEATGGAYAATVTDPDELPKVLQQAMEEVRSGRSAVVDVRLAKISNQKDY